MEDGKLKRYNCHKCGFKSDYIVYFKNHICSKKYKNVNPLSLSKKFSCSECGYSCRSSGLLKLHKNIHYDGLYKCSLCTFVTNFENLFKMHMGEHNDKASEIENSREQLNHNGNGHLNCRIPSEESNDTVLRVSQKDDTELKKSPDDSKRFYQCSFCHFKAFKVKHFGNHLLRIHLKEVNSKIGNFVGIKFLPKKRNSLSASEVVELLEVVKSSENNNISGGINPTKFNFQGENENINLLSALKISHQVMPKFKKINTWTKEDKMEIYWCDIFSRNEIFPKNEKAKRRRRALYERGILDREKLQRAPNSLLHSITANIRIGKSVVSLKEALAIARDAESYIKSKERDLNDSNDLEILFDFRKKK